MPDYSKYRTNKREDLIYYPAAAALLFALGILFYRDVRIGLLFACGSLLLHRTYAEYLRKKRLKRLLEGFRDALYIIAGAVAAGRQMPQAVADAARQSAAVFGADSDIAFELGYISDTYSSSHGRLEDLLADFGRRSGIDEIRQFAVSYEICRKNGGDAETVCMKSADLLLDKIEFQKETKALISEKKLDIAMLTAMPIGMVLFLNVVSTGYLDPLYGNGEGRMIMTVCLLGIAAALKASLKITDIEL